MLFLHQMGLFTYNDESRRCFDEIMDFVRFFYSYLNGSIKDIDKDEVCSASTSQKLRTLYFQNVSKLDNLANGTAELGGDLDRTTSTVRSSLGVNK